MDMNRKRESPGPVMEARRHVLKMFICAAGGADAYFLHCSGLLYHKQEEITITSSVRFV